MTNTLINKQAVPETVTGFIEKLEALPRHGNLEWYGETVMGITPFGSYVLYDQLRAIIEQEKSKISEGLKNSQAEQPTPQDVIDAEQWRFVNGENGYVVCQYIDTPYGAGYIPVDSDEIEQAMKGA